MKIDALREQLKREPVPEPSPEPPKPLPVLFKHHMHSTNIGDTSKAHLDEQGFHRHSLPDGSLTEWQPNTDSHTHVKTGVHGAILYPPKKEFRRTKPSQYKKCKGCSKRTKKLYCKSCTEKRSKEFKFTPVSKAAADKLKKMAMKRLCEEDDCVMVATGVVHNFYGPMTIGHFCSTHQVKPIFT